MTQADFFQVTAGRHKGRVGRLVHIPATNGAVWLELEADARHTPGIETVDWEDLEPLA